MGDFSSKDMYNYVKNLYSPIEAQMMTNATIQVDLKEPITFKVAIKGLKKLAIGMDYDTLKFSFEMPRSGYIIR